MTASISVLFAPVTGVTGSVKSMEIKSPTDKECFTYEQTNKQTDYRIVDWKCYKLNASQT